MGEQTQPPRFSILLATIESRADLFAKLHEELKRQAIDNPVEILVECDNKQISIGAKRQKLLERASGDYVAFVDDDDWISYDYVSRILVATESSPDCVGFEISCTFNGGSPRRAITSIRYPEWVEGRDGYAHCRSIYHKSPVRRDLALQVGFPDLRYGEDREFSRGIMNLVRTEEFIPHELYKYRYHHEPFKEKYGFKSSSEVRVERRRLKPHPKINLAHKRRPFQH